MFTLQYNALRKIIYLVLFILVMLDTFIFFMLSIKTAVYVNVNCGLVVAHWADQQKSQG